MDAEVKVSLHILKEIRVPGKVAQLTRARKAHECAAGCGFAIQKGEDYYCIYLCGAGLGDKKFPARVHIHCINDNLDIGGKKCQ